MGDDSIDMVILDIDMGYCYSAVRPYPAVGSHTRTVLSLDAEASNLPSGLLLVAAQVEIESKV